MVVILAAGGCSSSGDGTPATGDSKPDPGPDAGQLADGAGEGVGGGDGPGKGDDASGADGGGGGASCEAAIDITSEVIFGGTYKGKATAVGASVATCRSQSAARALLRLRALQPGNYEILVTAPGGSAAAAATVSVRDGCDSPIIERACNPQAGFLSTRFGQPQMSDVIVALEGDWFAKGFELQLKKGAACIADGNCTAYGGGRCRADGVCVGCIGDADCEKSGLEPLVCHPARGACVGCGDDDDCRHSWAGAYCDPSKLACGCRSKADCGPGDAQCIATTGTCGECSTDADCVDHPRGSHCAAGSCTCAGPADCDHQGARGSHCVSGGCRCSSPTGCLFGDKPACVGWACGVNDGCTDDDAFEHGDDGPAGASDVTPGAGGSETISGHKICTDGLKGTGTEPEQDWFKLTAKAGERYKIALTWTPTAGATAYVGLLDEKAGKVVSKTTSTASLSFDSPPLAAGVHYLRIDALVVGAGSHSAIPYTLTLSRLP